MGRRPPRARNRRRSARLRPPACGRGLRRLRRSPDREHGSHGSQQRAQQGLRRHRRRDRAPDRGRRRRARAAHQRGRPEPYGRRGRPYERLDHLLHHARDGDGAQRHRGLHVAWPAPARARAARGGARGGGGARPPACDVAVHRIRRPAPHPRAGHLSRAGQRREPVRGPERHHPPGAAHRDRPRLEHHDDARRRGNGGDRGHEGHRRASPGHTSRVPANGSHAGRDRRGDRCRAGRPARERARGVLRVPARRRGQLRHLRAGPCHQPRARTGGSAARGSARGSPSDTPAAARDVEGDRVRDGQSGATRRPPAPRELPAAQRADRPEGVGTPQAAQPRHGRADITRRRHAPRAAPSGSGRTTDRSPCASSASRATRRTTAASSSRRSPRCRRLWEHPAS
jgi:hypothetical protein